MTKKEILQKLIIERQKLLHSIEGLNRRELTKEVVSESWTVKDILGHLVTWEENFITAIRDLKKGKLPKYGKWSWNKIHIWNKKQAEKKRHLSLSKIVEDLGRSHREIIQLLESLPEDLLSKEIFPDHEGGDFLYWFRGSWKHNNEHYPTILEWRKKIRSHRAPWECVFAKEDQSKCRPGLPPQSDQEYFEILSLCVLQIGLNWGMVRRNWSKFKRGFLRFDLKKLAAAKTSRILKNPKAIKNRRKVEAIIANAQEFLRLARDYGSFSGFLLAQKELKDEEVIKRLKKRFNHIGEYTAEYFLHSVGYWSSK